MMHNKNMVFILLSIVIHTTYTTNIYYEELQALKKTKDVFHNDHNPRLRALRTLNQSFENYKNLSFTQQLLAPLMMLTYGVVVTPETMPKLHAYVSEICAQEKIRVPIIFISTYPGFFNACAQEGFLLFGNILIGQEMLALTQEETEAIVAHELGHIKHHHVLKELGLDVALTGIFSCTLSENSILTNFYLALLCARIIINKSFEKEADLFACQMGKAEGIKTFFANCHDAQEAENIAFRQTLDEIGASKNEVSTAVYYCNMIPLYYGAKLGRYIRNGMRWLYHNTPLGEHPCHAERAQAAQEYLDAHAS